MARHQLMAHRQRMARRQLMARLQQLMMDLRLYLTLLSSKLTRL